MVGEVDPESLAVIKAADSPTGKDLLIIAGSVSGSLGVYEIGPEEAPAVRPRSMSTGGCQPIEPYVYAFASEPYTYRTGISNRHTEQDIMCCVSPAHTRS